LKAWIERERLDGEIADCLTLVLPTKGCSWDSCYMCNYTSESDRNATQDGIYSEFLKAVEKRDADMVKIFTSGSFFDEREVEKETREKIYRKVREKGFRRLVVESRPEFVSDEIADEILESGIDFEVGIGVETSNDDYRMKLINKGFTFQDFVEASRILRKVGRVKAYLLLKPPLLTEREAIDDILRSVEDVKPHADTISLNLMTVHSGTVVEELYLRGVYRPPWLWSAVEILKKARVDMICDPVAGGKRRGPHNCFRCDREVVGEIRKFSLTQDRSVFITDCECIERWRITIQAEELTESPVFP